MKLATIVREAVAFATAVMLIAAPLAAQAAPPATGGERIGEGLAGLGLVGTGTALALVGGGKALGAYVMGGAILGAYVVLPAAAAVVGVGLVVWGGAKLWNAAAGKRPVLTPLLLGVDSGELSGSNVARTAASRGAGMTIDRYTGTYGAGTSR